jgi:hypothetical protein
VSCGQKLYELAIRRPRWFFRINLANLKHEHWKISKLLKIVFILFYFQLVYSYITQKRKREKKEGRLEISNTQNKKITGLLETNSPDNNANNAASNAAIVFQQKQKKKGP